MTAKAIGKLVCAALLGAAVALPAGMMLGGVGRGDAPRTRTAPPPPTTAGRAVYSPKVLSDPWFLEQQRKGAEALAAQCRATGEMCAEAEALRHWLAEHGG